MKSSAWLAFSAAACVLLTSGKSEAQSADNLSRLEARIEALAKENASLRDRVRRIEASRQIAAAPAHHAAAAPVRQTQVAASAPATSLSEAARTARAADYPVKAHADPGCAATRFSGGYAGVHAGAVNYTANRTDSDAYLFFPFAPTTATYVAKSWGAVAGMQAGYNWTRCNTLWGVEVDGSWSSAESETTLLPSLAIVANVKSRLDGLGTARVRAGMALDNMLLYVTGGVAVARTKTEWTTNLLGFAPTETLTSSDWRVGWVAGFGAEWALTDRFSLRSEALYVDLADRDYSLFSNVQGFQAAFKNSDSMWIARLALNYKWSN